jgi:hypothetical protein
LNDVMVPQVSAAVAGYTGALQACLQLMGPAVLHAYKHGGEGVWVCLQRECMVTCMLMKARPARIVKDKRHD